MIRLKNILQESNTINEIVPAVVLAKKAVDTVVNLFSDAIKYNPKVKSQIDSGLISTAIIQDIETAVTNTKSVESVYISSGHRPADQTATGNLSRHATGCALDIAMINGKGWKSKTQAADNGILEPMEDLVATFQGMGYSINTESGNPKALLYFGFDADHNNHIHISNITKTPSAFKNVDIINTGEEEHQKFYTIGSTGPDVKLIQQSLVALGYDIKNEDQLGKFESGTAAAILEFQKFIFQNDKLHTGIANTETMYKLYNLDKSTRKNIIQNNSTAEEEEEDTEDIGYEFVLETDHTIISVPNIETESGVIIFGGYPYSKFGPEWLEQNTPEKLKNNKIIIYVKSQSTPISVSKFLTMSPIPVDIDAIIGFSSGARNVWQVMNDDYYDDYQFIGLIDPVTPDDVKDIELKYNVALWARPSNWPDSNKNTKENLQNIIKNHPLRKIKREYNQITQMYPEFMKHYLNSIINPGAGIIFK